MKMTATERRVILFAIVLIAFSLFFTSLKGRYQYVSTLGLSHDTWTGKVYAWGTRYIDKSKKQIEAKRQKEEKKIKTNKQATDDFVPIDDFEPIDK